MSDYDTVYGIYISDALKLLNHRARRSGIQHRHAITPLDPTPGQGVTVRFTTLGSDAYDQAALYVTTDGRIPAGSRGAATTGTAIPAARESVAWDPLVWGYVVHWQAEIPGQPDDTLVQYQVSAWRDTDPHSEIYADWPSIDDQVQHATQQHYGAIPEDEAVVLTPHFVNEGVFNYAVDTLRVPDWAANALIYHIFVDRFYPGDGVTWTQTADLDALCGGTLWGVRDKLDYIADLGVNAIWLSPTWACTSYHGYDITDYKQTAAHLGGDAALRAVIEGAHARGIRVLLDWVPNHMSYEHPIFVEAQRDPDSPYRDWFYFDPRVPHGYKAFFSVQSMPRINLNHPPARDWMIDNAVYWLREFDVDGYRLDVADGPGPNFWTHFRKALRQVKPDALIFGEIIDVPDRLRVYAGRLDGCLDFTLNEMLRHTFALERFSEAQYAAFVRDNDSFHPPTTDFLRPTFLDNHDMNRFSYLSGGDKAKLKRAAQAQMALPGPHILYYGTEIGLAQDVDHTQGGYGAVRALMPWDPADQDADLLAFYQALFKARRG